MIIFDKGAMYDIGDIVTCMHSWFGIIERIETIGNMVKRIECKTFYLYNNNRFTDGAFREHIFSKLEFEELERIVVDGAGGLQTALVQLKIDKEEWMNHMFVDDESHVYCKKWKKRLRYYATEYMGKLIRITPYK